MQDRNSCSKFKVIMLINQPICEERVAIYEAEKDTVKKRNGKVVTFYRKEKSNHHPWISAGQVLHLNGNVKEMHKRQKHFMNRCFFLTTALH